MRKALLILLLPLFMVGCDSKPNDKECRDKFQQALKIHISDRIKITDYEMNAAVGGDYSESFNVHLQKEEFYKIKNELNLQKCFSDTTAYCYQVTQQMRLHYKIISITFYPDRLLVNYSYIEE